MEKLFHDPFLPLAGIAFIVGLFWTYQSAARYQKRLIEFRENLRTGDRCRVEFPGKRIINCRVVTCEADEIFQVIDIDSRDIHFVNDYNILMP